MLVNRLQLQHLRRFHNEVFDLDPKLTLIYGHNGQGKSTILEAIFMGSTGQSSRTAKASELVNLGQELGRIGVLLSDQNKLVITVTTGQVGGKRTHSKLFTINDAKKRQKDFVGQYLVTLFCPEDMRLIEGSPARRRDYLDVPLSLAYYPYSAALKAYQATLLRRNKLLQAIKEGQSSSYNLDYWNETLLRTGQIIQKYRQEFFDYVSKQTSTLNFQIVYDHSLMTSARLEHYANAEKACGYTLIGPHRDDFDILFTQPHFPQPVSLKNFGSRGQQRLAVLWLKLAELNFLETIKQEKPVLLLDDIFSELDEDTREQVLSLIESYQTILTTAEPAVVELLTKRCSPLQINL